MFPMSVLQFEILGEKSSIYDLHSQTQAVEPRPTLMTFLRERETFRLCELAGERSGRLQKF
jgi:hypothetical protein